MRAQHARPLHLGQKLVAFPRPLADAGKDRDALVLLDHGVDQLHHQHGLADAGTAEHRGLAAGGERREEVDDLDAGLEQAAAGRAGLQQRRRRVVDAPAPGVRRQDRTAVADSAGDVDQAAEHGFADRHFDRSSGGEHRLVPRQTAGRLERDRPDCLPVEMAVNLQDQRLGAVHRDREHAVDRRQIGLGKAHVDHRAPHGDHLTRCTLIGHDTSIRLTASEPFAVPNARFY